MQMEWRGAGVREGGMLRTAAPSSLYAGGFADRDLDHMRTMTGSAMDMGRGSAAASAGGVSSAVFTTADLNAGGATADVDAFMTYAAIVPE
ncbi:hypothetical protein ID866_12802 [Astraeus odoratus]|nr:hypothetical protein ID866_12802 [Astraeus odoratus]